MSGNKLVVDTNIILYILNGDANTLNYIQGKDVYISSISEIELLSYSKLTEYDFVQIKNLLKTVKIVELTASVKDYTISIRKKYKFKLPDSIVLATAAYLGIPLLTADRQLARAEEETDIIIYNIS
ncbi:PIN domain-containing protein [Flavobacterium sp. RHBU_24]|uniref:PIN domain-containing protein n=1 Tax=Flavobacterium sp. RHBU_24 TaxID=3391185 RepID=UPI003985171A